jgi:nucleoside-triphosphatase
MGKTTAIKKIVEQIGADQCGGFYTEEIKDPMNRIGFSCVTLTGEIQEIASIYSKSPIRIGRYGVDIENFERIALPAIQESMDSKKVTIIDEIGFMQMGSVPFQHMIYKLVSNADNLVVGTVPIHSHPEIDKIKKLPGVTLYSLNEENRFSLPEFVVCDLMKVLI